LCVGEFNGRRLYTGLRLDYGLDYRLKLWAVIRLTSTSRAISAVAELFVKTRQRKHP